MAELPPHLAGDRTFRSAVGALEAERDRARSLASHLFQMVPREVWREHGAEHMGMYEGDHRAAEVAEEIRSWGAA
jgi:hypothetical protein